MAFSPDYCYNLALSFNEPFPYFSSVTREKIIEIVIEKKQNFKSHLKNICSNPNQKLSALTRT